MAAEELESEPLTREEAKRILRRLELDAYSAIVTAFRAQGDINKSKKHVLHELSNHLSISTERHRAEVRRVVNDDRLNAVAECMHGPGTCTEWGMEGRRLVSLMPRLVPQTVFTAKASAAANQAVDANKKLPIKTEIEVTPLPTKPKPNPVKSEGKVAPMEVKTQTEGKISPMPSKDLGDSKDKLDDRPKKKKKLTTLYSKPTPLALNKSLASPFRPASATSLKPAIKSPLKTSMSYSLTKVSSSTVVSPVKYPSKPIILQRSPTKNAPSLIRSTGIHLHSLNSSINSPLTSLGPTISSATQKPDTSVQLIQSPMIKVVSSTSIQSAPNILPSTVSSAYTSSIAQKIKFKTPLPKPKVKATKFKPMVPIQRPGLLSTAPSLDNSNVLVSSSHVSIPPISPNKSIGSGIGQGSVKVVQVTKSVMGANSPSSSILNGVSMAANKPLVVVTGSNQTKTASQRVLAFSNMPVTGNQQVKIASIPNVMQQPPTASAVIQKSSISPKSMPLATGFKMIAVTTVVPGTTQVKTVYIATPIMSLTKTVSQTTSTLVSSPAVQSGRTISSSLASTLQTAARSAQMQPQPKVTQPLQAFASALTLTTTVTSSSTSPSLAVGKSPKFQMQPVAKGFGSLRTTLSSSPQSLKLFTAVSKGRPVLTPSTMANTLNNMPIISNPGMNTSNINIAPANLQKVTAVHLQASEIQHVNRILEKQNSPITTSAQAVIAPVLAQYPALNQAGGPTTVTLNVSSLEEVSTALNLLETENLIATENLAIQENTEQGEDMALWSAGEKYLEQLSAKFTANSPDVAKKNENFIFPSNVTLDMSSAEGLSQKEIANIFELASKDVDFEVTSVFPGHQSQQNANQQPLSQQPVHQAPQQQPVPQQHMQYTHIQPAPSQQGSLQLNIQPNQPAQSQQKVPLIQQIAPHPTSFNNQPISQNELSSVANVAYESATVNAKPLPVSAVASSCVPVTPTVNVSIAPKILHPVNATILPAISTPKFHGTASAINIGGMNLVNNHGLASLKNVQQVGQISVPVLTVSQHQSLQQQQQQQLQKIEPAAANTPRTIINYTNITSVNGKLDTSQVSNAFSKEGSVNENSLSISSNLPNAKPSRAISQSMNSVRVTSPQLATKLHMSIPGSSKLNISPILANSPSSSPSTNSNSQVSAANSSQNSQNTVRSPSPLQSAYLSRNSQLNNNFPASSSNKSPSSTISLDKTPVLLNQTSHASPVLVQNSFNSGQKISSPIFMNMSFQSLNSQPTESNDSSSSIKKRKAYELSPPRIQAGWIRGASNLLQKVTRFRGSNKQKGEISAASWFAKPVDPKEAPGYEDVVKKPMDFSKIRKRLEEGQYISYKEFYEDMMLIKHNCHLYNPEGHVARADCDAVFEFFESEYKKLLERWQKCHLSPAKKAKLTMGDGS